MIWPYSIAASIIFIFGACVVTVVIAIKLPVEKSDTYMMDYHQADADANELIEARIAFDKSYKIVYLSNGLNLDSGTIQYKVTDLDSNPVNSAKLKLVLTRPNTRDLDQTLSNPTVESGVYTFNDISLPVAGRWDIMAKVKIGEVQRYYSFKVDTRDSKVTEF